MLRSTNREQAKARREQLRERLGTGLVYFPGAKEPIRNYGTFSADFRQSSHVLYFSGVTIPGCGVVLDLDEGQFILFANEMGPDDLVWHDKEPSHKELQELTGADSIQGLDALSPFLTEALSAGRKLHVVKDNDWGETKASEDLIRAVVALRLPKTADEIRQMDEAMRITAKAHELAMAMTRPGLFEHEIQAAVEFIFRSNGALPAYGPIATCRGEVLHACKPHRELKDGQLFLLDAGAELSHGYATDITRAWPVNGRFSEAQGAIYDVVLRSQKAAIAASVVGQAYGEVHKVAAIEIIEGLKDFGLLKGRAEDIWAADAHALFFPHGVGHMIGLDVHDLEDVGEDYVGYGDGYTRDSDSLGRRYLRLNREMKDGFVVTIEPGVYFIPAYLNDPKMEARYGEFVDFEKARGMTDFGGIRIEDDVHITADGPVVIGPGILKERSEIEALVGSEATMMDRFRI